MGINVSRLVMPTRENLEMMSMVLQAATGLIDMKRQVDRVEQELRTLSSQRDGIHPTPAARDVGLFR